VNWFHEQLKTWSQTTAKGPATLHVFRKTSLQFARVGEDVNRLVATDAKLTTEVMMSHYVAEGDEQLRQRSNRMYRRLIAGVADRVLERYGYRESLPSTQQQLQAAIAHEDWQLATDLTSKLAQEQAASRKPTNYERTSP
jgi:hypothetical protein